MRYYNCRKIGYLSQDCKKLKKHDNFSDNKKETKQFSEKSRHNVKNRDSKNTDERKSHC